MVSLKIGIPKSLNRVIFVKYTPSMRILLSALLSLVVFSGTFAQYNDIPYRQRTNALYWKNRPPYLGYWQQDVYYKLKANVDDATDIIDGTEELIYWNNSPDTLTFVYFHLYQNAFQPGSYTDDLHKNNDFPIKYGKYEAQGLGTTVDNIIVDGQPAKFEMDNTVMKVWLTKPLRPGYATKISMNFKTYFDNGSIRRRMKTYSQFGYKHYDGVHWYPRIAVYDRKFGWETDQHLTREFYGDYGVYDVEITLPNNYIMDATGVMTNEQEMLPPALRQQLDISNFAKKPWESAPSEIIKRDGTTKTWKFHAENVHDFAWTADPTYRIGEVSWNGIRCIALCSEQHCSGWQDAAAFTAKVIETYSTDFGMYIYPKMIVADARDGMEYPMLTLDGGRAPDYYDLIAHEVGHNWFFGMVGSNETYRALLDEGFTQFLTAWSYEKIKGDTKVRWAYRSNYAEKFREPEEVRMGEAYNGYIYPAASMDETVIDNHSDHFGGALRHGGGYGQVYSKTATMLYNLQYVLGDSLFLAAMHNYFDQYKVCHPYVEDFRNSVIQFTHVDLNWFFDQWLTTAHTIDYKVAGIHKGDSTDQYEITFKRKGRMQMPIDFTVYGNDGRKYNYYIPNTWFEKETDAKVLPRWIGWDNIQKTYTATVTCPTGVKNVRIDTTYRLADVNLLDNSKKLPYTFSFDSKIYNPPSWKNYRILGRPDIWYNGYDGFKGGFYIGGVYMNGFHQLDISAHINTGILQSGLPPEAHLNKYDQFDASVSYRTPTNKLVKNSSLSLQGRHLDGLDLASGTFDVWDRQQRNRFWVQYKMMYRADTADIFYLLHQNDWDPGKFNNTVTVGYEHPYYYMKGKGVGNINMQMRTSAIGSDYNYQSLSLNVTNKNDLGKININTRTYMQVGTGDNWAKESMLFASGANPEQMMENKYTRSQGIIPVEWGGFGADIKHFQTGGGLNLRGYAGYQLPTLDWYGNVRTTYKGTSGMATNVEIEFQELFRFIGRSMPRVNSVIGVATYAFGDAGVINYNDSDEPLAFGALRADAGLGMALTVKRFPPLQTCKPLTIRFDVPLFINRAPYNSPQNVAFRWVIGINRAF
jgi:aminopeptidase N